MMAAAAVARALIDGDDAEQLAQLCQTSKAEAIGAIATEIIHDFNNLLTPMITIMDQIQRDCDHSSVRSARRIESAIACAERAQQLVHRILNFARPCVIERNDDEKPSISANGTFAITF